MATAFQEGPGDQGVLGTSEASSSSPNLPGTAPSALNSASTIAATASHDTLGFILNRDWIYHATFSVTADMQAGTVFGVIPIHPAHTHTYIQHVAKMFKFWTGHSIMRARFVANAMNGGSFRLGFLPPSMTKEEVQ